MNIALWHAARRVSSAAMLLSVACATAGACTSSTYRFRGAQIRVPPAVASFIAGAAKVDITPPPGFPLAGHSIAASVARGYWSRLFARAFYFRDVHGRAAVLVSTDLYAVSAGLRLEVVRRVNQAGVYLPPDGFVLAATHTHHGPGGHMTSEIYNTFGAALPGFDRTFFDVLAGRISSAIVAAARSAGPAGLAVSRGAAPGIQRNRAVAAFAKNDESLRTRITAAAHAAGVRCPGGDSSCPRYDAVDPSLTTLTVVRGGEPIAILVVFGVHSTAMSHTSPLYVGDFTGRAMSLIEQRSGRPAFVAGFFSGAQGDISPDWRHQNRDDVLALGERLAEAVSTIAARAAPPSANPVIGYAMHEFPRNWRHRTDQPARLASKPLVGAAALGGAEDGRTMFHALGWRAGIVSDDENCEQSDQGCKEPGLGRPLRTALENLDLPKTGAVVQWMRLTSLVARPRIFPAVLPISVIQFGDLLTMAAVPVEITTAMAWRIRESMAMPNPFVIVGLANEYFSYTTTPKEYTVQAYEGASTVAGRQQGPAIEAMVADVAARVATGPPKPERVKPRAFRVGSDRDVPFGPDLLGPSRPMIDEELTTLWPHDLAFREQAMPRFSWTEPSSADWSVQRRVWILDARSSAEIDSDDGPNVLSLIAAGCSERKPCKRPWTSIWMPPAHLPADATYYFAVQTGDGRHLCSPVFPLVRPGVVPVADVGAPIRCPARRPAPSPNGRGWATPRTWQLEEVAGGAAATPET